MFDDVLEGEGGRSPHEPDEPDPEAGLTDYEAELAPSVDVPEAPSPRNTAETEVPTDLLRKFWVLVLAFNAALLAGSLGAMYVLFRGDWSLGGRLLLAGAVCLLYGLYRLRTWDPRRDDADAAEEPVADGGPDARDDND